MKIQGNGNIMGARGRGAQPLPGARRKRGRAGDGREG